MPVSLKGMELKDVDDICLKIVIGGFDVTQRAGQRHLAFMVGMHSECGYLYHLGTHNKFIRQNLEEGYAVNEDDDLLDKYTANALIGFLAVLHSESKGKIPYSIEYSEGQYFNDEGQQLKNAPGDGLTCATFVMEVLSRYGATVIDRSTWPTSGVENAQWQSSIISLLIRLNSGVAPIDTFEEQIKKVGQVARFRPEEVMGAACEFVDEPLTFQQVAQPAQRVVEQMRRLGIDG